jgi:hypothetical protein
VRTLGLSSSFTSLTSLAALVGAFALPACGTPEIVLSPTGGAGGAQGGGGAGGSQGGGGAGGNLFGAGGMGAGGAGGAVLDPCDGVACDVDQSCQVVEGVGTCVNNTCDMLQCSATESCETGPNGGAVCVDISCSTDLDCPVDEHCNGTICVLDVCVPGTATCAGDDVLVCEPNGSGTVVKFSCGSDAYYTSVCVDDGQGAAACTCEDDWDCPANTTCEVGTCVGTGVAPTCSLPPVPFASALPVNEIQWGGTGQGSPANQAVNAPFPLSSQVSATPLVVNLDDDNGDGLINERDFPEIVFVTYCGVDVSVNGIVRAIHGGGPNKGQDFFATCGGTVWHEGDDKALACPCSNATANSTASPAVGDLDGDGVPEIVVPNENAGLTILDNRGNLITSSLNSQWTGYANPAVAIANVDQQGFAELVVGRHVFTLEHDANGALTFVDRFSGALMNGSQGQGPVSCIANVAGDARLEIVGGTTAYRMPTPPPGVTKIADCAVGSLEPFCLGQLEVAWDGQTVNGAVAIPNAQRDGFCAIADVLGVDQTTAPSPQNPLDGKPEVVLINEGHLLVLDGETGTLRRFTSLLVGNNGGAPNIDDFDGDGFPEIGTAFGARYVLIDLQEPSTACPAWPTAFDDAQMGLQGNPARDPGGACTQNADCAQGAVCNPLLGACTCLHNGWQRITEDNSSQVTSSSVFDFNGDGAAEVIYNDECFFRVYDGRSSEVLFKNNSPSRTRIENPVVADVDNDGNAEIVFCSNNDANTCSAGNNFPNGIAVWGDASDSWVSARRIYNQHAYHVTNVTENAFIPAFEPESWKTYDGRVYNTYRSNPRNYNVAPDLVVAGVQLSSPDVACGQLSDLLTITTKIDNQGDLRVGPGVTVTFYGVWAGVTEPLYADASQTPLTATLQASLEPGDSVIVSVAYDAIFNTTGTLPDDVLVIVDELDLESECVESNNSLVAPVVASMPLADLRLELGAANGATCPSPQITTTIINDGAAPAQNVLVRYYAGDPNAGGTFLHEEVVVGPIVENGGSTTFTATLPGFPNNLSILVYGIVDPDDAIAECNDGNNKDAADNKVECGQVN